MTAARHIPHNLPDKEAANWPVTLTYNGSTLTVSNPAFMHVNAGDTVDFINASPTATLQITFAANPPNVINPPGSPLFGVTSITLGPGANSAEIVLPANGSVNYTVTVNGVQVGGHYAIQVGNGPLYVTINNDDTNPGTLAVPPGGTLEMYSTDGNTYDLSWTNTGNPFPTPAPGLLTVTPGVTGNIAYTNSLKSIAIYDYTFPTSKDRNGGGTIKVGGG
jgi:plastocyanin